MSTNAEIQSWKEAIQEFFEWYAEALEYIPKTREHGYNVFIHNVPIWIEAFKLRLEGLQNLSTPKFKECKKTNRLLEESVKQQIKALQLEAKYFQDIQDSTLAGRFGAGAVTMAAVKAGELLKKSLEEFRTMFQK